jgi:hypothetical protein
MFSKTFFVALSERSIKTFFQAIAALLVGNGTGLLDTDWVGVISVAGMAALISVATSIGSATVGNDGPSLAGEDLER